MYKLEKKLYEQLCKLKDSYNLQGIKAEFEAEGSSFRDLMRLRRLTSKAGVKLFLKIGGVEAIRDIKDALEIDVDGIIAPMIESKFGAKKFHDSIIKIYGTNSNIHTTLNIETKIGINNIDDILEFAQGKFNNITLGRSDLSESYFEKNIKPDSLFIFNLIETLGKKVSDYGVSFTIGGSVSVKTRNILLENYSDLNKLISKFETRKVMIPTDIFINKGDAIKEALKFEELYILSKKDFSDIQIDSELQRLTELKRRMQ